MPQSFLRDYTIPFVDHALNKDAGQAERHNAQMLVRTLAELTKTVDLTGPKFMKRGD
jgi:hypothetical protein